MKAQKVRKGFGLRGVRAVLGSRVGRGLAVGLTLLLLHLDVAPAVVSASVEPPARSRLPLSPLATRLMLWAMRVWALQSASFVDKPPLAPARWFAACLGRERKCLRGCSESWQRQPVFANPAGGVGERRREAQPGVQLASQSKSALARLLPSGRITGMCFCR